MVYRVEASGFLCFLVIALMAISGCGDQIQKNGCILGVIFGIFIGAVIVSVWLPNSIFDFFGDVAIVTSAVFLVAQTLLVADWGYMANDYFMGAALDARRRNISSAPENRVKIALVVMSILFLIAAVAGSVALWIGFDHGWLAGVTLALSLIIGFVSILECVKHGNVLTSALVAAYEAWLTYEVLITQPDDGNSHRPAFFMYFGVVLAAITLFSAAFHTGLGIVGAIEEPMVSLEAGGEISQEATIDFMKQSILHCCATLFIATEFAPKESTLGFAFRIIALVVSFVVYLGTLLAPLISPDRFG